MEFANLLRQHRTLSEELASQKALLDALPMPVWFRDAEGQLIWVNRAYISAVEAARTDDVIEHQRELLETRQRRAAETALQQRRNLPQAPANRGGGRTAQLRHHRRAGRPRPARAR